MIYIGYTNQIISLYCQNCIFANFLKLVRFKFYFQNFIYILKKKVTLIIIDVLLNKKSSFQYFHIKNSCEKILSIALFCHTSYHSMFNENFISFRKRHIEGLTFWNETLKINFLYIAWKNHEKSVIEDIIF